MIFNDFSPVIHTIAFVSRQWKDASHPHFWIGQRVRAHGQRCVRQRVADAGRDGEAAAAAAQPARAARGVGRPAARGGDGGGRRRFPHVFSCGKLPDVQTCLATIPKIDALHLRSYIIQLREFLRRIRVLHTPGVKPAKWAKKFVYQ